MQSLYKAFILLSIELNMRKDNDIYKNKTLNFHFLLSIYNIFHKLHHFTIKTFKNENWF